VWFIPVVVMRASPATRATSNYFIHVDDKKTESVWIKKDDKNKYTVDIGGKTVAVKILP
jgi:hypothetical protein